MTTSGTLVLGSEVSGIERILTGPGAAPTAVTSGTTALHVDGSALAGAVAINGMDLDAGNLTVGA